jgi:hypothetical protein
VHSNLPEDKPLSGLEENYCRNPDGEVTAWCYTTDSDMRFELCAVPTCGSGGDVAIANRIKGIVQAFQKLGGQRCLYSYSYLVVIVTMYSYLYLLSGSGCQPRLFRLLFSFFRSVLSLLFSFCCSSGSGFLPNFR